MTFLYGSSEEEGKQGNEGKGMAWHEENAIQRKRTFFDLDSSNNVILNGAYGMANNGSMWQRLKTIKRQKDKRRRGVWHKRQRKEEEAKSKNISLSLLHSLAA